MLEKLLEVECTIGNTPLRKLTNKNINLFTKLEYCNPTGSLKDRSAIQIIKDAIINKDIDQDSEVIESSSGNLALALSNICSKLGLKFSAVIDTNVNQTNERLLQLYRTDIYKVTHRDQSGGFLLNRLEKVKQICATKKNIFWTNQYANKSNYLGYKTLAGEIANVLPSLDFLFVAVSSGGSIAGLSKFLKKTYPNLKVIAVDIEGSMIFQDIATPRHISGLGSSFRSPLIDEADIQQVVHLSHLDIFKGCLQLFENEGIFAGASSGATYYAIQKFFQENRSTSQPNVLFCCADYGYSYQDTVYNAIWRESIFVHHNLS
ncbi:MAG: pyridoxal-phosphate dependent enzyme [Sphingobacterium sp.]